MMLRISEFPGGFDEGSGSESHAEPQRGGVRREKPEKL
jgi:hypothetical protein